LPGIAYNVDKHPRELKPHKLNIEIYGDEKADQDLIESIRERGILESLVIKHDGTIVSGHRRWLAAKELKLDKVPCRILTFNDELDEEESLIEFNRQRDKNFTQRMKEKEHIERIEEERARRRQASGRPPEYINVTKVRTTLSELPNHCYTGSCTSNSR